MLIDPHKTKITLELTVKARRVPPLVHERIAGIQKLEEQ
jgi:hypothetical protein